MKGDTMDFKDKEKALSDYVEMTKKSWTYARLTEKEKGNFQNLIDWITISQMLKGAYVQRWDQMHIAYIAFLHALGYNPPDWRG